MYKRIIFLFYLLIFCSLVTKAHAGLEIIEIMYNPEGADDGYEYVKIKIQGQR